MVNVMKRRAPSNRNAAVRVIFPEKVTAFVKYVKENVKQ